MPQRPPLTLCTLRAGSNACVTGLAGDVQSVRLREMGLCEGQRIEVLCAGNPMICRVGQCRVGLCAKLAAGIQVSCQ